MQDLRGEIRKVATFLGRSLTEDELDNMKKHLSFSNFQENPMVNNEMPKQFGIMKEDGHFIRKGIAAALVFEYLNYNKHCFNFMKGKLEIGRIISVQNYMKKSINGSKIAWQTLT